MISEIYYHNIRYFIEFLQENHINFFPICGTLLGIYREDKVLEHDNDIDIAIDIKDADRFKQLIFDSELYHFHMIWRREVSVIKRGYTRSDSQIDVFFMDSEDDKYCLYTNEINSFSKIWDIERKLIYKKEWFDKFNYVKFMDKIIQIPHQSDKILEAHYDNWNVTNKNWETHHSKIYDKTYREIAIIIPTFLRDNKIKKLIESIQTLYPKDWYRLYIADQGYSSIEKNNYYQNLRKEQHFVTYLPFNCGLSYIRNYLIKQTKEPFILIVDDDFIFDENTKIQNFITILNHKSDIGVVGGDLEGHGGYHYKLIKMDDKFYYIRTNPKEWYYTNKTYLLKPVSFWYCDIVLNFALFKREVFDDLIWDNDLKLCEHTYYYWNLKKKNKWKVAYTPSVKANHQTEQNSTEYIEFRRVINTNLGLKLFYNKIGINKDCNFIYLIESNE